MNHNERSDLRCNNDGMSSYILNLPNSNNGGRDIIMNNQILTHHGISLLSASNENQDLSDISNINSHLNTYQGNEESLISALNNELMSVINQGSQQTNHSSSFQLISDSLSSINDTNANVNELNNRTDSHVDYFTTININGHNIQLPISSFIINKNGENHIVSENNQICNEAWNSYNNCSTPQDNILIDDYKNSYSQNKTDTTYQKLDDSLKAYECTFNNCGKRFKTSSELSRHAYRHNGERHHKCDRCDKAFFRQDDLKRHYFTHTGEKLFKCDLCEFKCIQSYDLVKHKITHIPEKPFQCDLCHRRFTRPARLKEHMRLHTGEKPFTCNICCRNFSQRTSFNTHMNLHNNDKSLICNDCDRPFNNANELAAHQNRHSGQRPHTCDICQKQFISSKTLKKHFLLHSGEKPFECEQCNRKFIRASDLKLHTLIHADEKPFKCNDCDKSFTRIGTLKDHQRLHTGDYPYKCEICSKSFNHKSHLTAHLRVHSNEKIYSPCTKSYKKRILNSDQLKPDIMSTINDNDVSDELNVEELCEDQIDSSQFITTGSYNADEQYKTNVIDYCRIPFDKNLVQNEPSMLATEVINVLNTGTTSTFKSSTEYQDQANTLEMSGMICID